MLSSPVAVDSSFAAPSLPSAVPVQAGPSYACFLCGAEAQGLRFWPTGGAGSSPLDALAAHIAYLTPTCTCHQQHPGCTRVAVLDNLLTPLTFATDAEIEDWYAKVAHNVAAVEAALAALRAVQGGA